MPADRSRFGPEAWIGIGDLRATCLCQYGPCIALPSVASCPPSRSGAHGASSAPHLTSTCARCAAHQPACPRRQGRPRKCRRLPRRAAGASSSSASTHFHDACQRSRDVAVRCRCRGERDRIGHRLARPALLRRGRAMARRCKRSCCAGPFRTTPAARGQKLLQVPIGQGLAGAVAASRVAEIVPDVRNDPRGVKIPGTDDVDESMIVVPFVYEDAVARHPRADPTGHGRLRRD